MWEKISFQKKPLPFKYKNELLNRRTKEGTIILTFIIEDTLEPSLILLYLINTYRPMGI